jgi:hypothetical protein
MPHAVLPAILLVGAVAAAPDLPPPSSPVDALSLWTASYRSCYQPQSFSFKIDRAWTIDCVDRALQRAEAKAPADMKAVLTALGAETPRLIDVINGAGPATPAGAALAASRDPASPAHSKAVRPVGKD